MSDFGIVVSGGGGIDGRMEGFVDTFGHAMLASLVEDAEETMTLAKTRTPVRYGNLRGTGAVMPIETPLPGGEVRVRLSFGGGAVDYAVPVHERTDLHHTVGRDHFLSSAVEDREVGRAERLAEGMAAAFARLAGS